MGELLCPNFEECEQGALEDLGHIAEFRQKAEAMATCLVETEEWMLVCRSVHGFIGPVDWTNPVLPCLSWIARSRGLGADLTIPPEQDGVATPKGETTWNL